MLNYEETIRIYFNDVEEIELFSKYKLYLNNGSVLVGSFGFEEINEPYFEMENMYKGMKAEKGYTLEELGLKGGK